MKHYTTSHSPECALLFIRTQVLKKICWYVVLAPSHSTAESSESDHATLMATTVADKHLAEIPAYKDLLQTFITNEASGSAELSNP